MNTLAVIARSVATKQSKHIVKYRDFRLLRVSKDLAMTEKGYSGNRA